MKAGTVALNAALLLSNRALLPVADKVAFGFDGAAARGTKRVTSIAASAQLADEFQAWLARPDMDKVGSL